MPRESRRSTCGTILVFGGPGRGFRLKFTRRVRNSASRNHWKFSRKAGKALSISSM